MNDETAGHRTHEDAEDVNADGTVGVGTDGSLVSDVDRGNEAVVGVGTDGSLVGDPEGPIDDTDEDPDDAVR